MKRTILGLPLVPFSALTLVSGFLVGTSVWLFIVTAREREEALAQIPRDRAAVELGLSRELREDIDRQLKTLDADIDAALSDPFLPTTDLLFVDAGRVVLPRHYRVGPAPGDGERPESQARDTLAAHVADGDAAYQAWLDHRARFQLPAVDEARSTLAAIEVLARAGTLTPARADALFRDGVKRPDGRVAGLFALLLERLDRWDPNDAATFFDAASALARRFLVRVDDVRQRLDEARTPVDPARYTTVANGTRGRRLDWGSWLAEHQQSCRAAARCPADAQLTIVGDRVEVATAAWDEASATADERFTWKALGISAMAVLAVVVFVLAVVLQRRRMAFLELRARLLRAVTHELKTPLASISALAQTLELRAGRVPEVRDYPTRIVGEAERMSFLIDNILSYARLEGDAWKPSFSELRFADLGPWLAAEPVARAMRPVDLELDLPSDVVSRVDVELVRLMLSNLVDNAAKYTTKDRVRVRIDARRDASGVELHVSDDGPGLGALDPDQLFEDFRRGHVGEVRGTGLGLSICRWVAELHGGAIRVAASGPDGTTFHVRLGAP